MPVRTYSWKIYHDIPGVEYWYDCYVKCWFAATVDKEENLGPTSDAYTKTEIIEIAKELAR